MLSYKLEENGGTLIKVNPHHTSQSCAECAHTDKRNRQSQADSLCLSCGHKSNADTNAAKTILARALSDQEIQRWNTPVLDVEDKAGCCNSDTKAPYAASTYHFTPGLDARV